jgi:hypothetical protein
MRISYDYNHTAHTFTSDIRNNISKSRKKPNQSKPRKNQPNHPIQMKPNPFIQSLRKPKNPVAGIWASKNPMHKTPVT